MKELIIFKANTEVIINPPKSEVGTPYMVLTTYNEDLIHGIISVSGHYATAKENNGEPSGQIDIINYGTIDLKPIHGSSFQHTMSFSDYRMLVPMIDNTTILDFTDRQRNIKIEGVKHILTSYPQYGLNTSDWSLINYEDYEI